MYRAAELTDRGLAVVPQERVAILTGPDVLDSDGHIQVPGLSAENATHLQLLKSSALHHPMASRWPRPFSLSALGHFDTLSAN